MVRSYPHGVSLIDRTGLREESSLEIGISSITAELSWESAYAYGRLGQSDVEDVVVAGAGLRTAFASVSKLVTALAIHIAVEEETLSYGVEEGLHGASVHDLLCHASGLRPDGAVAEVGDWSFLTTPGRRRIYSNLGFELLGTHLEAVAEIPFGEYVEEAVLRPSAMAGAAYDRTLFVPGGIGAAAGLRGGVEDLVMLVRTLSYPGLVDVSTLAYLRSPAYPSLPGVLPGFGPQQDNLWGLGPEIRSEKSPHWSSARNSPATFGHFGRSGSLVWIDPVRGCFLVFLSERPFDAWALRTWPLLSDAVLDVAGG